MPPPMEVSTSMSERARGRALARSSTVSRILGHPAAYVLTALVLLWIYGWPFIANPLRVAPTKDPAYYTWRIEALVSEKPGVLQHIRGAFDMFGGGYRVANAVIGAFLREIADISLINVTVFIMVGVPVVTSLLLAGFAYRQRRDPLIWHATALGSAGLLLTPPYVGYMDNLLCLLLLAAAIWFIGPSSDSWAARIALFVFLLAAGMTHPTTLAFFILTLFFIAAGRFVLRGFRLTATLRDDLPMLVVGVAAVVVTYVIWKVGIWGPRASLSEAALPPPYSSGFFIDRTLEWFEAMRPVLNGVLFAIAAVALVAMGRRSAEDDLARVSLGWLLPLVGLFGFVIGLTYPYYRFLNTTLAIPLLVGLGAFFALRFLFDAVELGGAGRLALIGVLAVVFVLATNFTSGLVSSGWINPGNQWITVDQRRELGLLRSQLAASVPPGRPVVFVIDSNESTFKIWGFTKLSGNTSRFGLPRGQIDQGYLYLGSLRNYLAGRPTLRGEPTYDKLSRALLRGVQHVTAGSGPPVTVVVDSFNATGANTDVAAGRVPPPGKGDVWVLNDRGLTRYSHGTKVASVPLPRTLPGSTGSGWPHLLRIVGALALLALPGWLAFRSLVPEGGTALGLGMVPALAAALLVLVGIFSLAIERAPFSGALIWSAVLAACVIGGLLRVHAILAPQHETEPTLI